MTDKANAAAWHQRRHAERMATDPEYVEKRRRKAREYMARLRTDSPARRQLDRDYARDSRLKDPVPKMINAAKHRAKVRGLPFDLTLAWARQRWTGRCELTDIAFEGRVGTMGMRSPSIDRRVSALGYVQGNCRFVLQCLNGLKGTGTDEDLLFIAGQLLRRRP